MMKSFDGFAIAYIFMAFNCDRNIPYAGKAEPITAGIDDNVSARNNFDDDDEWSQ